MYTILGVEYDFYTEQLKLLAKRSKCVSHSRKLEKSTMTSSNFAVRVAERRFGTRRSFLVDFKTTV